MTRRSAAPTTPLPSRVPDSFRERLQDLPPEVGTALMAMGARRQWRRGQVVLHQGVTSGSLVVVLQGRLAAHLVSPDGRDTLLRWLDEGELVGLPDVLAGLPVPVTIKALGPAQTLHVDRHDFIQALRAHPEGAIGVAVLLSRRLGELFRFLEMSSARPLADRVAYALQRLARSHGVLETDGALRLRITQAELAMAAGASRQRVHLELQRLQAEGRLRLGYGTVTLLPG
jgi:CRP/FNR family cyclic AMP-dependent transcriptional regulator